MNQYIVGYSLFFDFGATRQIEVEALNRVEAEIVAKKAVIAQGIGYGGNLDQGSFKTIKKVNQKGKRAP